jgi:hypothetical protein
MTQVLGGAAQRSAIKRLAAVVVLLLVSIVWWTSRSAQAGAGSATKFKVDVPAAMLGQPVQVTVTAQDANGNTAADFTDKIHFTSGDSTALLPADYTFTGGDAGVHQFTVTFNTAGSQSLTATDTTTASIKGTGTTTVTPPAAGPATQLNVDGPGFAIVGQSVPVTVTALDDNFQVATGYAGAIHFTSSDGTAVLPGDYTFVAGDHGAHTFHVAFKSPGDQTVTATDKNSPAIAGESPPTTVAQPNIGTATHFSVTAPSTAVAGQPAQVTVAALDTNGAAAPGYRGAVHVTSDDGAATLPEDYAFTSADNGSHQFTVTFNTPGAPTVTATDTATTPAITGTSDPVIVSTPGTTTTSTTAPPTTTTTAPGATTTTTVPGATTTTAAPTTTTSAPTTTTSATTAPPTTTTTRPPTTTTTRPPTTTTQAPTTTTTRPATTSSTSSTPTTAAPTSTTSGTTTSGSQPTVTVTPSPLTAGQPMTVSGTNLPANQRVEVVLHSAPVVLGSATVSGTGTFSLTTTLPADTAAGAHSIEITSADGATRLAAADVTVAAAGSGAAVATTRTTLSTSPLSVTGANSSRLAWWGVIALGLGAVLVLATKAERRSKRR